MFSEAAVLMVGVFLLNPIILLVYIKLRKLHTQTWGGWSFDSLTEWWQFLRLSLSGLLMVAFEWWSFEISALVTGSIDELQLATNSVLLQLTNLTYSVSEWVDWVLYGMGRARENVGFVNGRS